MKIKSLIVMVAFVVLSLNAFTAEVIFNDPNLLSAVRVQYEAQVGVPLSDPPTDTELADPNFVELDASYLGITDLTGLEACTSLVSLNLIANDITDITPVSGLTSLVYLMVGRNQITNISSLSGLTSLQYLDIGMNQISDISVLNSFINLIGLNLGFGTLFLYDDFDPFFTGGNNLDDSDLTVLASLTTLEVLSIGGLTNVSSISFLSSLNNLRQLWLGTNPISDWTPLGDVDQNLNAFLSVNCGLDQTVLENYVANMTNITALDEENIGLLGLGFENVTDISVLNGLNPTVAFLVGLGINDIDVIQDWTNLYIFVCSGTGITNINAILGLQNIYIAEFSGNNIGPSMFTVENPVTLDSLYGLSLSQNVLTNLNGIEYMPNLVVFDASFNQINDIYALDSVWAPKNTLEHLNLSFNQIVEINPLINYTELNNVLLNNNLIENFGYLEDNEGIGDGDYIDLRYNPVPDILCYIIDLLEAKVQPTGAVNREGVCEVTVTIELEGEGNVLPSVGANTFKFSSNVIVLAYPQANSGYAFDHWEIWNEGTSQFELLTENYSYFFMSVQEDMLLRAVFVPGTYTLTFEIDPSSTGTGTVFPLYDGEGVYSYKENQLASLYALPDPGACFGGWTGDAGIFGYSQFVNIIMDSNKNIGAVFSNQCYQLTIEVVGDGFTSPSAGTYQYVQGINVNILAFPGMGYQFDHWEDGNSNNLGTDNPINVEITQDLTIRAIFIPIPTYTLTISINGSGTTNPTPGIYVFNAGSVVSVSATPDEGWAFSGWSGDIGGANPFENPIQILMDGNKVITANFLETDYMVEVSVEGPGTIDPVPGTYYYFEGQWAFFNAIPDPGKAFAGWYENGIRVWDFPAYAFQVTSNRVLVARFEEPTYTIELNIQGNGTTNPPPGIYGYVEGQWLVYIAYPGPGWAIKHWITTDEEILSTDELLILYVERSLVITAVFEPCDWDVNIAHAGTGTGDTNPDPGTYCYINNRELDLYAQPAVDNYFGGWQLIKNPLSNPEESWVYWFNATVTIDGHYNIIAYFNSNGWLFNFQVEGDGVVQLTDEREILNPGVYALANNFPIKLTAIPNLGQVFKGWYSGEELISTNVVFETVLNDNLQLTAKFKPQVWYTLLLNVVEGQGTTAPNPGIPYLFLEGQTQVVRALPANGWIFVAWTGDIEGIANIDQPEITVPMNRNRTIGVIFARETPEGEGVAEGEGTPEGVVEGEGEGEGTVPPPHSGDQDGDGKINLSELLRVIQFFNFGEYHCEPGTEDGYAPGPGNRSCTPHASDYNPQDWVISLSELLRLIQFFNIGGYYPCESGEDGYCPGSP